MYSSLRSYDVLVVGGGIAGTQAALSAKEARPSSSVAMIFPDPLIYSKVGLTSIVRGSSKSVDDIALWPIEELESLGIDIYSRSFVEEVDSRKRSVIIRSGEDVRVVEYDSLIWATGGRPYIPDLEGIDLKGVYSIRTFEDAVRIAEHAKSGMKALVVGAGFIGLEVAEALKNRGLGVTIIELRSRVLWDLLEPELSQMVKTGLLQNNIRIFTDATLEKILGDHHAEEVLIDGARFSFDLIIFCTGVRPNTQLASEDRLKTMKNGAIATDERMSSSISDIYACGDCAQTIDLVTKKKVYRPLGTVAARSGFIAGSNSVGSEIEYSGFLRRQFDRSFRNGIASMGLTTEHAKNLDVNTETFQIEIEFPEYLRHMKLLNRDVKMLVIVERGSDRLLGMQAVGELHTVSRYSNFFKDLVETNINLNDLQKYGFEVRSI